MRLLRPLCALIYCGTLTVLIQRTLRARTEFQNNNIKVEAPASAATCAEFCCLVGRSKHLVQTASLFDELCNACPAVRSVARQWLHNGTVRTSITLHSPLAVINDSYALYDRGFTPTSFFTSSALTALPHIHTQFSPLEDTTCAEELIGLLTIADSRLWNMFDTTFETMKQLTFVDKHDARLKLRCHVNQMPSVSLCATAQTLFQDLESIFSFENPDTSLVIDMRFSGRLIVSQAGGSHGTYKTGPTNRCH